MSLPSKDLPLIIEDEKSIMAKTVIGGMAEACPEFCGITERAHTRQTEGKYCFRKQVSKELSAYYALGYLRTKHMEANMTKC